MFLKNTGHSIHCERPAFLAEQMMNFFDANVVHHPARASVDALEQPASRRRGCGARRRGRKRGTVVLHSRSVQRRSQLKMGDLLLGLFKD